jgi:hypothetical protein
MSKIGHLTDTEVIADIRSQLAAKDSEIAAIRADWRKRGEALKEIRDADQTEMALDPEWPARIARAALAPKP